MDQCCLKWGQPDMRTPISYTCLSRKNKTNVKRLISVKIQKLTFFKPDLKKYPCLELAYHSLETKKSAPTILNAANEVAVEAFLNEKDKVSFHTKR